MSQAAKQQVQLPRPTLSPLTVASIGGFSGAIEVVIQQPSVSIKVALQDGRAINWSLGSLYRGTLINAASMTPITAVQFGSNALLCNQVSSWQPAGTELSPLYRFVCAVSAGAISGLVSTPAELLMIQQQRFNVSLVQAARHIVSRHGVRKLFKGLTFGAGRDGIFTGGYLALSPILQRMIQEQTQVEFLQSDISSTLCSSIFAGVFAAALSHPLDTLKTRMQGDLGSNPASGQMDKASVRYATPLQTFSSVYKEGGLRLIYGGMVPRALRIIGAVFILSECKSKLTSLVEEQPQ